MRNNHLKTWLFFAAMIILFIGFSYVLFHNASGKEYNPIPPETSVVQEHSSSFDYFVESIKHNIAEPAAMLLLQIIAILIVTRILSGIFIRIGQPTVIAEIISGILLGPSLLGLLYPDFFRFLFAPESIGNLNILSLVGLVLFMFVIGMELSLDAIKEKMGLAFVIGQASIIIPFFMGLVFAYISYKEFAYGKADFIPYALFLGLSMSITAFPVLARIVHEKGMSKKPLGQIAIASAAFNDVTAWCILAVVIAISKTGSFSHSLYTIGFALAYILFMMFVVKPFLKKIGSIYQNIEVLNKSVVAFIFLLLTLSAFTTQLIGIHALFGAFLVGVIMPEIPEFRKLLVEKVEDVALTLLFPLFFVYTGLRTDLSLLNSPHVWNYVWILIAFAFVGKLLGSALTAKLTGQSWRNSLSIGTLMNTHGLMEVVVLNIGYDMGIISPSLFVMLVIMALSTTFMTSPLLYLIDKIFPERDIKAEHKLEQAQGVFKVLIAMGNPKNSAPLLNVAKSVLDGAKNSLLVRALHITPGADTNPIYSEQFASESFKQIIEESENLNIPIETEYKITDNVEACVVKTVNQNYFDFLLVGAGISLSGIHFFDDNVRYSKHKLLHKLLKEFKRSRTIFFPGDLIKDKTRYFIENSKCSVGVFVNRGFMKITTTVVLLHSEEDVFLLRYARRLLRNNAESSVFVIALNKIVQNSAEIQNYFNELKSAFPVRLKQIKSSKNNAAMISRFSFMMVSYPAWNALADSENGELTQIPSTLIINKKTSRFTLQKQGISPQQYIDYSETE